MCACKHKDRNTAENMFRSHLSVSFIPYLSLSLVLTLPLEQLRQGRRSTYSFLIKLLLCHPGPQSNGGGDCWQENEAYECVRSASDRFMGHQCQHIVEENKMFEYQSPSDVHRPIANLGAIRATGRTDVLLYHNLSLIKPDLSSHMLFLICKATMCLDNCIWYFT